MIFRINVSRESRQIIKLVSDHIDDLLPGNHKDAGNLHPVVYVIYLLTVRSIPFDIVVEEDIIDILTDQSYTYLSSNGHVSKGTLELLITELITSGIIDDVRRSIRTAIGNLTFTKGNLMKVNLDKQMRTVYLHFRESQL